MIDQKIGNYTSNIGLSILLHKNLFVCYQIYKFLFHDFLPLKAFTCRFLQSVDLQSMPINLFVVYRALSFDLEKQQDLLFNFLFKIHISC